MGISGNDLRYFFQDAILITYPYLDAYDTSTNVIYVWNVSKFCECHKYAEYALDWSTLHEFA